MMCIMHTLRILRRMIFKLKIRDIGKGKCVIKISHLILTVLPAFFLPVKQSTLTCTWQDHQWKVYIFRSRPQFSRVLKTKFGAGALHGKMLLVRIIENNDIDAYLRCKVRFSKG